MKTFIVRLSVEKLVNAYVKARDEEEAKLRAMDWSNIYDEETESEEIKEVEVLTEVRE